MRKRDVERGREAAVRGTSGHPGPPFGAKLRRLRDAAGMTQEELAARAGLTAKAVGALERGERRRPYPHTVRSLADALNLPEDERLALQAAVPGRPEYVVAPRNGETSSALPASGTSLVGRRGDVEEVAGSFLGPETGLLTLTGPGGVSKTRLAT